MDTQYAIIGGGIVGIAIAYGLQRLGCQTIVLDEGDSALRASRGNFGLVWVQSKGMNAPHYAQWSQGSAALWSAFAKELEQETNRDLCLTQRGGYDIHLTEDSLEQRIHQYEKLRTKLGGRHEDYPFEVLSAAALKREEPEIGPKAAGAILHHQDGHVNPLRLLTALHQAYQQNGGQIANGGKVTSVKPLNRGYQLHTAAGKTFEAEKVVICAGLGANALAETLGFITQVSPLRGQNIITEKLPHFINRPSMTIRQVNEGGIQLGDSKEDVGYDDGDTVAITARIAQRAVATYPILARVNMVRSWGALRIMSPDGLPVYTESTENKGCYLVTCHSGITLAAAHSLLLPRWLEGAENAPDLEKFNEKRFRHETLEH